LSDLANTFDLCVLVINQMTTKIGSNLSYGHNDNRTDSLGSPVVPALGESWAHATTTRILLAFDDMESNYYIGDELGSKGQRRICKLIKSPHKAAGMASFMVTEFGLRDCIS
jgi:RAD51-like protein 2